MDSKEDLIQFELNHLGETISITCHEGEYRNLMVLINEKIYVEDFGECKGIGRCGTCLVEIITINPLPELERNEKSTLEKCAVKLPNLRLSCQIMIDQLLNGATISIVEEREDVR